MIGELEPYPEYKDSGLPWVSKVPSHWDLVPNRDLLRRRKVLVGDRHPEYQLLSLTKLGVIVRDLESGKGKFSADMGTSQEVRAGDLIFCLFDVPETPRTVGLSAHNGMITGAYTVFECSGSAEAGFLDLFYRAMDDRKLLSPLYSGLRNTIPPTTFLGTKTPVPPPREQAAIVRFLKWADRQIRRLIRARRKRIELLEEYKQALIHRTVTRGLDPNVPLKDSGLPWCPQVPCHWKMTPNRELVRQRRVLVGERHVDYILLSLTKQGVIVRDLTENKGKFSSDMGTSQEVRRGDLVMCLFDVPETPRTVGLSQHDGMITGAYTVFETSDGEVARWLEAFYIAMDDRKLLSPLYSGLRNTIPRPRFLGVKTPIPPSDERQQIFSSTEHVLSDVKTAISGADLEVKLISEYYAGLVADVVTGNLDVRKARVALAEVYPQGTGDDLSNDSKLQLKAVKNHPGAIPLDPNE